MALEDLKDNKLGLDYGPRVGKKKLKDIAETL